MIDHSFLTNLIIKRLNFIWKHWPKYSLLTK